MLRSDRDVSADDISHAKHAAGARWSQGTQTFRTALLHVLVTGVEISSLTQLRNEPLKPGHVVFDLVFECC